jgi:hypothetical protein
MMMWCVVLQVGDSVVGWEKAVLDDTLVRVSVGRAVGVVVLEGGTTRETTMRQT